MRLRGNGLSLQSTCWVAASKHLQRRGLCGALGQERRVPTAGGPRRERETMNRRQAVGRPKAHRCAREAKAIPAGPNGQENYRGVSRG